MKIWAHRGCSQNYPENTVTAFEKACAISRLAGIETDIQISKDGHLMVFHDERVDRTTDGTGFLRDYTYEELRVAPSASATFTKSTESSKIVFE